MNVAYTLSYLQCRFIFKSPCVDMLTQKLATRSLNSQNNEQYEGYFKTIIQMGDKNIIFIEYI